MICLMQVGVVNLYCSWLNVLYVIQFDQLDIIDMEVFCVVQKVVVEKVGVKLIVLLILFKVCVYLFKELLDFNSLLVFSGKVLICKKYVYIGFVVDILDGLLVLVICDVDWKSFL